MANQLLSELFDSFASKTGIDTTSEEYQAFIQDKRISEITVPENVASHLTQSVGNLTIDAAKNNSELAKHYKVKYLTTVDNHLKNFFKGKEVPEDFYSEIEAEPDTIKRVDKAMNKIYEYVESKASKKSGEPNDAKYKELVEKHNALMAELNTEKSTWTQKEKQWQSDLENKEIDWQVDNMLASYQYSDSIPADDAKFLVKEKMKKLPYVFKKTENGIGVYQKENADLMAYAENNKPLSVKDILDKEVSPYTRKTPVQSNGQGAKKPLPQAAKPNGNVPLYMHKLDQDLERFKSIKK